jgi:prepilin-type N-terminal cleavage/methylation domain-containing protein
MKTNVQQTRRGFTLVELLVVIVIIASLAGLTAPMVIRQRKKADQTEATNNARQIGLAMLEFENDYGSYPSAATLEQINESFADSQIKGQAGNDSNGFFKQLFQAGLTQSEAMFYAKAKGTIKPDGDISSDANALEAGEVGFGYILDGVNGLSSAGNPARAVVATPVADGSTTLFDGDPFDRKAVILRIDNSVSSVNIRVGTNADNQGPAIVGGQDLLSSTNPVWGSGTPTLVAPLKRN